MSQSVMGIFVCVLCSRSSQRGLIWSKYDCTVSSELLILQQPNLIWWYTIISESVLWKKLEFTTQRVKRSMFIHIISSKLPNILLPNLAFWCIIMNLSVMQKDWFAIFKVKIKARASYMIKIWQFLHHLLNCWSFCN